MKTLRSLAVAALVVSMALALVGCGGGGGACSVDMRSGKVYFQKNKDYVKAEQFFRKAAAECPQTWEPSFWLAMTLAEQARYKEAGQFFKAAREQAPEAKKVDVRDTQRHYFVDSYNAGVSANQSLNYKGAVTEFEKAIGIDPDDSKAYVNLAYAYSMLNEPEKSMHALEAAVKADSNSVDAWRNFAVSLQRAKDYDRAQVALEHVLVLQPGDVMAQSSLGDIYFEKKDYKKALENYSAAAERRPDDMALLYQVGAANFRLENYKDAGVAFQKCAALSKDKDAALYGDAMYNLGVCYVKIQDYDAAIATFETLLATHDTAESHEMLGAAYVKKGLKDKAIAQFEKAKTAPSK
jgi:tetratricopeptide (TPR) repeat protein